MEDENEHTLLKSNRVFPLVLIIAIVHLGVFSGYWYFLRPEKGFFQNDKSKAQKKTDFRPLKDTTDQPRYPNNPNLIQTEKPKIYSWAGSDGDQHKNSH